MGVKNSDTQKALPGMQRREAQGGSREEVAICKPRREASGEIGPADTVSLDFQPPEL